MTTAIMTQGYPTSRWSRRTALDPKHRPQLFNRPASTVRREWARYPQEAHVLDSERARIRRFTAREILQIQGFPPNWCDGAGLRDVDVIRAAGNAVPPPLAAVIFSTLKKQQPWIRTSHIEICAGAGGMASGAEALRGAKCLGLHEFWEPACKVLAKHWPRDCVVPGDLTKYDFSKYRGPVGILSGGPPCQPWSRAGEKRGFDDPRDLLGNAHALLAVLKPDAFVFENVPGLLEAAEGTYFDALLGRLRGPADGLVYGVSAGVLNAADFGVPQVRRRLFLIGLRERPQRDAFRIFDGIQAKAIHSAGNWRTLSQVIRLSNPAAPWMHWPFGNLMRGVE